MLISLSGCEGVGKSSASHAITELLAEMGIPFEKTREPGGSPIAEEIRRLLKDFHTEETFYPLSELLLFYTARFQLFNSVILPQLNQGKVIISDRSYACTFAYQLRAAQSITEEDFWAVHNIVMKSMPDYDLIFYLYTNTVEEGMARARQRGELDRIEQNEIDFFKRAEAGYREFYKNNPNVIYINTSTHNEYEVRKLVRQAVKEKLCMQKKAR